MKTVKNETEDRPAVLVSTCLMGVACRYHGRPCATHSRIRGMLDAGRVRLVPVCPEVSGGLPVPRPPTRPKDGRLWCGGEDVTEAFEAGAQEALRVAVECGAKKAYLVRGSPSCDRDKGVAARLLQAHGIKVIRI